MDSGRRLVAILFSDIQGYTALMQDNELRAMEILERFETTLAETTSRYHGEVVKSYGDGSICIFPSAVSSVACAVEIQQKLSGEAGVPLRIGLHLGDVIFKKGDIYGDAINIASRIESTAVPGSVLVSRSLYEKVKNQSDFEFVSLGKLDYKNVEDPVEVLAVSSGGLQVPDRRHIGGKLSGRRQVPVLPYLFALVVLILTVAVVWSNLRQNTGETDNETVTGAKDRQAGFGRSIAVLPFESIGGDRSANFTNGIHGDILTRLSKLSELKVISRTTVMQYQDVTKPLPEIANELDVKWVMIGEVEEAGGEVQVNARLVDAQEDRQVWAEGYRRELTAGNVFDIQAEITEMIAGQLQIQLNAAERRNARLAPTADLEAYRLFVEGRARLDQRTEVAMREALQSFNAAIARDSSYALAWVGKADALALLVNYGHVSRSEFLPEARSAARTALQIEPDLAEAHATMGLIYSDLLQGSLAERSLARATELNSNYADAYNWLSWVQFLNGNPEEAKINARKGVELNPLAPECIGKLFNSYLVDGDYEKALQETEKMIRISGDFTTAYLYNAIALYHLGRYREALDVLDGLEVPWAESAVEAIKGVIHVHLDDMESAEKILAELQKSESHFGAALILAASGETERAMSVLAGIRSWGFWQTLAIRYMFPEDFRAIRAMPGFPAVIENVDRSWGIEGDSREPG